MSLLFSYQGSIQRRVNSLLRHYVSNMGLMVEHPEEGCNAEVVIVATETQTSKRMSPAFSHNEEGLDIIKMCNILHLYPRIYKYLKWRSYYLYCNACYGCEEGPRNGTRLIS
jgi:hypothetical protein